MTKVNFFSPLFYIEIPASHQSEDSTIWALGIDSDSGDQADGDSAESALEKIPPNRRSRNLRRRGKFGCLTTQRNCMPTTKRRAAVYGLESSDTSDTPMLRCGRGRLF